MLGLKHPFHKSWLVLLQLSCETPSILTWKTSWVFRHEWYHSRTLVTLGLIRSCLFVAFLDICDLVYCFTQFSYEDSIFQQQDSCSKGLGPHKAVSCSSTHCTGWSFSSTAHRQWAWAQDTDTREELGVNGVQMWDLNGGKMPSHWAESGWKGLRVKSWRELDPRLNKSCVSKLQTNCFHVAKEKKAEISGALQWFVWCPWLTR